MENKFATKKASVPTENKATENMTEEIKEKKPRAPVVSFGDKVKVLGLIKEGKGNVDELVAAGVTERVAKIAIKTLAKEKMIKQSFVAV